MSLLDTLLEAARYIELQERRLQAGKRAYDRPDGEWLPLDLDFSNARGRLKPLPTVKI